MFAKLFSSMYDGTLATKGPWEAVVTFQQLLILADRCGVVDMTAEAIARRTTIPLGIIEKGIKALESPDPDSRRPDEDGRRIVRLADHRAWGWQIVNFEHYRAIRNADERREYQRNLMRERRAAGKKPVAADTDAAFDAFWQSYPKKVAKPAALRAWRAAKIGNGQVEKVMAALAAHKASADWLKAGGQFVPNPATWLNQRRFEDAPPAPKEAPIPPGGSRVVV